MCGASRNNLSLANIGAGLAKLKKRVLLIDLDPHTVTELSQKFDVSPLTMRNYIRRGERKARKFRKKWLVPESAIEEYFGGSNLSFEEVLLVVLNKGGAKTNPA